MAASRRTALHRIARAIAPDTRRSAVKDAGSILPLAKASRHKIELPANAAIAVTVAAIAVKVCDRVIGAQNISLGPGASSAGWSRLTMKSPVIILS